jgi:hypothetical protein
MVVFLFADIGGFVDHHCLNVHFIIIATVHFYFQTRQLCKLTMTPSHNYTVN